MLLNWPKGFGTRQLIYIVNMGPDGPEPHAILIPETINNWVNLQNRQNGLSTEGDNAIMAVAVGELMMDELADDEKLEFRDKILFLREKVGGIPWVIFRAEVYELWSLLYLDGSWSSLAQDGIIHLEVSPTIFVDEAVEGMTPTLLSKVVAKSIQDQREE